ncbi:MarR family winged helix-turn-helix transcriptional regulator [uncultured Treponema sp.]|uniref:MarR family winged helix-turn-helix transcriptional regulator n=1 Tax=uncultured Treponema sp. TaxID=162155 RepID=UPI0025DD7868|nr:MarR family transcriptional regulator [uncultured Treponema sp.]
MQNEIEKSDSGKYSCLRLQNQLCFPLYAASREILRNYTPLLKELDLTYTQYIVLMVLWEEKIVSVGDLGNRLFLDTGTLSPLLKSMEKKSLLKRTRDSADERIVKISITEEGEKLKEKAVTIPEKIGGCLKISKDEAESLYKILYKILSN